MSIFSSLIFDANALTYLYRLGLLETCLSAVEYPVTLDIVYVEELERMPFADVMKTRIDLLPLDEKMMGKAISCRYEHKGLTLNDAGLIILGQSFGYPVFTEDKKMIQELARFEVTHVSLLEVIEALVSAGYITCEKGLHAVEKIASEILPGRYTADCKRLRERFSKFQRKTEE